MAAGLAADEEVKPAADCGRANLTDFAAAVMASDEQDDEARSSHEREAVAPRRLRPDRSEEKDEECRLLLSSLAARR